MRSSCRPSSWCSPAAAAGLVSGIAVTRFGVTPLIATLGVNALLIGTVLQITSGTSTAIAADALEARVRADGGLPNTFLVAVVLLTVVSIVMRRSVRAAVRRGRREPARRPRRRHPCPALPGRRVRRVRRLRGDRRHPARGLRRTPSRLAGDTYLLPTIAAVVLGGTSLAGGNGSVVATAVGALFLIQLEAVVRGMGAPVSIQLIIQGPIIALGMAVRRIDRRALPPLADRQREEVVPGP